MSAQIIKTARILSLVAVLNGCSSFKYTTTVPPVSSPERFEPVRFYVAEADGLLDEQTRTNLAYWVNKRNQHPSWGWKGNLTADSIIKKAKEEQVQFLNEVVSKRYPGIFSSSKESIPLKLNVRQKTSNTMGGTAALALGSLLICPFILPLPFESSVDISIQPSVLTAGFPEAKFVLKKGEAKTATWNTIFTPLGLMPFPGKGDIKWSSGVEPAFALFLQCSEDQLVRMTVRGWDPNGARLQERFYGAMADILAASITSLDQRQIELLKEQYYKSMRVY